MSAIIPGTVPKIIGLVAHPGKPGAATLVAALRRELYRRSVAVRIEQATAALIAEPSHYTISDLASECDLIIVMGGDGTILNTVHALGENLRPIFGINLGLLGFLTCLSSADYRQAADLVVSGNYHLSLRTLLSVEVIRREGELQTDLGYPSEPPIGGDRPLYLGLNDAVISRGALSRLVRLETRIDGDLITEYNADGLIVATPTGSTAYSLSAGGPLLAPDSGVFAVTPICPHTLTNRSVIVDDDASIEIRLQKQQDPLYLTVDGQRSTALHHEDIVRLRKAQERLPLAMLKDLSFFELARRKLRWSGTSSF